MFIAEVLIGLRAPEERHVSRVQLHAAPTGAGTFGDGEL